MNIPYLRSSVSNAIDVPSIFNRLEIPFQTIEQVNWPDTFPYCPEAKFRIACNAHSILLNYRVVEDCVRGKYGEDNGQVWTDSCMEFFIQPVNDGIYYNLECNCIGTVLLGAGKGREGRELAGPDTLGTIQRWASLGRRPFDEKLGRQTWEVAVILPLSAFFKHHIVSIEGCSVKGNFYKCGDELQTPHFLSYFPIKLEKPNFHCPEFFGNLDFNAAK